MQLDVSYSAIKKALDKNRMYSFIWYCINVPYDILNRRAVWRIWLGDAKKLAWHWTELHQSESLQNKHIGRYRYNAVNFH